MCVLYLSPMEWVGSEAGALSHPYTAHSKWLLESNCCAGGYNTLFALVVLGGSREQSTIIGAPTLCFSMCGPMPVSLRLLCSSTGYCTALLPLIAVSIDL